MKIRKAMAACAVGIMAAGGMTACGVDDAGSMALTVEVGPSYWETPVRHAIENGWFEEAGLDVSEIEYGPESALPLVLNGQADIGVTGLGTVITHAAKGVPIEAFAGQLLEGEPRDEQLVVIVAAQGSGIDKVEDLSDKTVATNELKGPATAQAIRRTNEAGGDGNSIKWVSIPFPGMVESVNRGDVDAALASAPFSDQLIAAGGNYVSRVSNPGTPVPVYFTKSGAEEQGGEKFEAFREVLDRAYDWANENREDVVAEFAASAGIPVEAARKLPAMKWRAALEEGPVVQNIEDMRSAGFLDGDVTFDELVSSGN